MLAVYTRIQGEEIKLHENIYKNIPREKKKSNVFLRDEICKEQS